MGYRSVQVQRGKLEGLERPSDQAIESVRANEPGTLQYEIYFSNKLPVLFTPYLSK
jgi:quinol monooxygenase YgiN